MRFISMGEKDEKAVTIKVVIDDDFCIALMDQFVDQTVDENDWFSLVAAQKNTNDEYYECVVAEWDEDEGGRIGEDVVIKLDSIRRAIQLIASGDIQISSRIQHTILNAIVTDDTGEIDSEASDAIFQTIVFNEIRYG